MSKLEKWAASLEEAAGKVHETSEKLNGDQSIKCPRCGSTDYISAKQGYSKGRGVAGLVILGAPGLLLGTSKNKMVCVCKQCKHKWYV